MDKDAIQGAATPGGGQVFDIVPSPGGVSPFGIATDFDGGDIFWSDFTSGTASIFRRDGVSGAITSQGITGLSFGLAYHQGNDELFWTRGGSVFRGAEDLSSQTEIINSVSNAHGIAIDEVNGRLFFTDFSDDVIYRSNLDGSDLTQVFDARSANGGSNTAPRGIAYDAAGDHVYFVDSTSDILGRIDSDGSNFEELLDLTTVIGGESSSPFGLVIDDGRLYWSEGRSGQRGIYSADLDGSNAGLFLATSPDNSSPLGLATIASVPEPGSVTVLCAAIAASGWMRRRKMRRASSME
ncbi:MAG: hypothetical protein AAF958_08560 [Planctomycetota bacterium]